MLAGAGILAAAVILGFGYWLYISKEGLKEDVTRLESQLAVKEEIIQEIQENLEVSNTIRKDLVEQKKELSDKLTELEKKFTKNGRNLEDLSHKKPELIENIINKAIDKKRDCYDAKKDTWASDC